DRIRHAASFVIAKLERWRQLSLGFFADIQPLFVDVDVQLVKERDKKAATNFLWRGLTVAHAEISRRILEEEIEIAYADLYGYNTKARELFAEAAKRLRMLYERNFKKVLTETDAAVKDLLGPLTAIESSDLGNIL